MGAPEVMLSRIALLFFAACSLGACASSETRSTVSPADVPASKYKKVAVFIENLPPEEKAGAEQVVASAFKEAGIDAAASADIFAGKNLGEKAKASYVQKNFDAVFYLTVLKKGLVENPIPNAYYDGQTITYNMGILTVTHDAPNMHMVKPDGTVYEVDMALKAKTDVQDTKSAKLVWTSETVASGNARVTTMPALFKQVTNQIVAKMREDHAI